MPSDCIGLQDYRPNIAQASIPAIAAYTTVTSTIDNFQPQQGNPLLTQRESTELASPSAAPSIPAAPASTSSSPIPLETGTIQTPVSSPKTTSNVEPQRPQPTVITIGVVPFSVSESQVLVGGQTLVPGSDPITYSGIPISLGPSAAVVVVGSTTYGLAATPNGASIPTFKLGDTIYTENAASAFVIGSQTLAPGGVITISGAPVSLVPSATAVVIGGSTIGITPQEDGSDSGARPIVLTIGSSTFVKNSASALVVDGQTLVPGAVITADGMAISLALDSSMVVVGSSTEMLIAVSAGASEPGVGGVIWSAFNGGEGSMTASASGSGNNGSASSVVMLGQAERMRFVKGEGLIAAVSIYVLYEFLF